MCFFLYLKISATYGEVVSYEKVPFFSGQNKKNILKKMGHSNIENFKLVA